MCVCGCVYWLWCVGVGPPAGAPVRAALPACLYIPPHPTPLPQPSAPQAAHPVQLPKWMEKLLRIPGAGILLLLILFPLTLVRSPC